MELKRLTEATFEYVKKNGERDKQDVLVLDITEKGFSGISLKYLSEDEKNELLDAVDKVNSLIEKHLKSYRNFLNGGVVEA